MKTRSCGPERRKTPGPTKENQDADGFVVPQASQFARTVADLDLLAHVTAVRDKIAAAGDISMGSPPVPRAGASAGDGPITASCIAC